MSIDAMKQNQEMIEEWKQECREHKDMAFLMVCLNDDLELRMFRSAIMTDEMVIRQLELCISALKR